METILVTFAALTMLFTGCAKEQDAYSLTIHYPTPPIVVSDTTIVHIGNALSLFGITHHNSSYYNLGTLDSNGNREVKCCITKGGFLQLKLSVNFTQYTDDTITIINKQSNKFAVSSDTTITIY